MKWKFQLLHFYSKLLYYMIRPKKYDSRRDGTKVPEIKIDSSIKGTIIEFENLTKQGPNAFKMYASRLSQDKNFDKTNNEYFGYFYITGEKPNETNPNEMDTYDFGPFRFSWGARTMLAIKIDFGEGKVFRPYGPDAEKKLKESAKEQGMTIRGYSLHTDEIVEEIVEEEQYEEVNHDEISLPPNLPVEQVEVDKHVIRKNKGNVRKKTHENKNAKRKEKLIRRESTAKRKEIEEKLHGLELLAADYLQSINRGVNESSGKFNRISNSIAQLTKYRGDDKNLLRIILRSGQFRMMSWILSSLYHQFTDEGFLKTLNRHQRLYTEAISADLKRFLSKDTLDGGKYVTSASLGVPSTNRDFRHYIQSLFWNLDDSQEKIEKIFGQIRVALDIGSGASLSTEESILDVIKEMNPKVKTIALDRLYAQIKEGINPETLTAYGSQVDVREVIKIGEKNGHELISDSAQNITSIPDESVDLVTSYWVFDEFNDAKNGTIQALREIIRVTKPDAEIRLAPVNVSEKLLSFLQENKDCLEVQAIKGFTEQEIPWNNGAKTISISLKRKVISSERMEEIKKQSKDWLES